MVVIVEVIFSCVDAVLFVFVESDSSADNFIVSVFVYFCGFLSDIFDTFDKSVMISVGIVCNDTHSSINFDQLLPMRQLSRTIILNSLELIRVAIPPFEFVASVFVEIPELFYS